MNSRKLVQNIILQVLIFSISSFAFSQGQLEALGKAILISYLIIFFLVLGIILLIISVYGFILQRKTYWILGIYIAYIILIIDYFYCFLAFKKTYSSELKIEKTPTYFDSNGVLDYENAKVLNDNYIELGVLLFTTLIFFIFLHFFRLYKK